MQTLYKSIFYEILFDERKSLIIHKALPTTSKMTSEEFKQEMFIFLEMCEKYKPNKDLVHLLEMGYAVGPEMQAWVNTEIFFHLAKIIKRMAIVMPIEFISKLSIEQTMLEEEGKKIFQAYFNDEYKALEWLKIDDKKAFRARRRARLLS